MTNRVRRTFLHLPLMLLPLDAAALAPEPLVVMGSTEYPPYYGEHLPNQGLLTDIAVRAFRKMGYRVEVRFTPFARTLANGKAGLVDGVIALWRSEEREQWFAFSDPMAPNLIGFYKRKSSGIRYNTLQDLAPYRIGVVNGYADPPAFIAAKLDTDAGKDDEANLRKLIGGHLDLVLIDRSVAQYLIQTRFPGHAGELEWLGPPLEVRPQYIGFSKAAPHYREKLRDFNLGMKKLAESGELQAIMKRGGLSS
ncbi:MAG TPA: transporter substrate-binding domain-containing protein [Burkholderiaceae bacterium]